MTRSIRYTTQSIGPSVLHVVGSLDPRLGGASQGLRDLLPLLDRLGSRNEVLCLDDEDTFAHEDHGLALHAIGRPRNPWQYNRALTPWLERHGSDFDVVVIHGLWLHHGLAVSKWVRRLRLSATRRPPLLMAMPHGMLDPWFQESPDRRMKAVRNRLYWELAERSVIASVDALLFTSTEEMARARRSFPRYPDVRERVVGFGTMPPPPTAAHGIAYPYTELPLAFEAPYLLYLGRIHEKKGVERLVEAYSELRSPALPPLLLAGPGWESSYGRRVREAVKRDAYLRGRVHIEGMLSGSRKWQALRGCEALVLPSRHENFGVVVAEALSCGRPVLLTDKVNTHREVVEAGAGLCETDTKHGVMTMLTRWQSTEARSRASMSDAALEVFETDFSMKGCAVRFLSVVRELLHSPAVRSPVPTGHRHS